MLTIRRGAARGVTDLGWLYSCHTFSFGAYYDPQHVGVSALRVINDDQVQPGAGFASHGHADMEILSYVMQGSIEHQDSMGHIERLTAGEFQLMTAGTGITHSEYNASDIDPLHFLQIWILPNQRGLPPGYQQKQFATASGVQLIASSDGREGSLVVHQDAAVYHVVLESDQRADYTIAPGRTLYCHVFRGALAVQGASLEAGDGATLTQADALQVWAQNDAEALLFDLP